MFESGDYSAAAEAFLLAYKTLPAYAVLANIGSSYQRAGALPEAVTYFRKYLAALDAEGKSNPRIEKLLRKTLMKVSEINISAECIHDDCHIYVDNIDRGVSPTSVVVLPGEYDIRAVEGGKTRAAKTMKVLSGETNNCLLSEIGATPPPKSVLSTEQEEAEKRDTNKRSKSTNKGMGIPFWVSTASAVGTGIAAAALWGAAFSIKKDFDNTEDLDKQEQLGNKGEGMQIGAAVATGIAGAASAAAIIFAVVHAVSSKNDDTDTVSIHVSRDSMGISFEF